MGFNVARATTIPVRGIPSGVMTPPAAPEDLYTLMRTPDLLDPVLLVHLDGWIDAGRTAHLAVERILSQIDATTVASFDTEWLIDHRAHRPTMHIVDGVNVGIDWPFIELVAGRDRHGNDVLLLHGTEPDHNWRAFVDAVVQLGQRFAIRRMIGLGSYPAAAPHTRPAMLSITASTPELVDETLNNASLDVPAGVESALEKAFEVVSIDSFGLWAQVPHYVSSSPYPPAALALIEGLERSAGLSLDSADLASESLSTRNRLDTLVQSEESHGQMLAQLEAQHDEFAEAQADLPSSDELAAEVERFLQSQTDDDSGDSAD